MAKAPTKARTAPAPSANTPDEPSLAELAQAILDRKIVRLRVAPLRRLAEVALAAEQKRAKRKAKAPETKKKGDGKKRKLAKIPKPKKRA
jgi:hypothetical protein